MLSFLALQIQAIREVGMRDANDLELAGSNGDYMPFRNEASPKPDDTTALVGQSSQSGAGDADEHGHGEEVSQFPI